MDVTLTDLTSTSVSFQWGSVDCIHRNGQITGYSITYNIQGSSGSTSVLVTVNSPSDGGTYTIIALEPSEMYDVQIAAQNTIGTALNTSGFTILTHGRYTDRVSFVNVKVSACMLKYTLCKKSVCFKIIVDPSLGTPRKWRHLMSNKDTFFSQDKFLSWTHKRLTVYNPIIVSTFHCQTLLISKQC